MQNLAAYCMLVLGGKANPGKYYDDHSRQWASNARLMCLLIYEMSSWDLIDQFGYSLVKSDLLTLFFLNFSAKKDV